MTDNSTYNRPSTFDTILRKSLWLLGMASLIVCPLSAQQQATTLVPDVEITVNGDTIVVNVEVMSDSTQNARIADAIEGLTAQIAAAECDQCGGTSGVVRVGQGALVLILGYVAYQLKRIADKPNGDTNVGDTHVEVNVPPHDHDKDHDSEGGSPR